MSNTLFLFFFRNVDIFQGCLTCGLLFVFSLFFCFAVVYQVQSILKIFFFSFPPLNPTIGLAPPAFNRGTIVSFCQ